MYGLRALGFGILFVHVRAEYVSFRASSPLSAAYAAFISYSRFKMPLFTALLVQVQPNPSILSIPIPLAAWPEALGSEPRSRTPQKFGGAGMCAGAISTGPDSDADLSGVLPAGAKPGGVQADGVGER
jgi:hypothetical protein